MGAPRRRRDAAREVAQIRREVRAEAVSIAELGCREAASALVSGDDERIYAVGKSNEHDERCGGRYFQDEPPSGRLRIVH